MADDEPTPGKACKTCPWRLENQGKPHPDGWFSKANRRRLWAGLRRGEMMSCHRTDPTNPVSDKAVAAGYKRVPEGTQPRDCTGAVILVQREVMIWQDRCAGDLRAYRRLRPLGLLRDGLIEMVTRAVFGGVPLIGGRPVAKPNLNEPGIVADDLAWPVPTDNPGGNQ